MTVTLVELRDEARQRLGDSAKEIWSDDELCRYIQQGYDAMTLATGCLYAVHMYPDIPFSFSYTARFEADYALSGFWLNGPAQFNAPWERDYIDNANGPANHCYPWEYHGWNELV